MPRNTKPDAVFGEIISTLCVLSGIYLLVNRLGNLAQKELSHSEYSRKFHDADHLITSLAEELVKTESPKANIPWMRQLIWFILLVPLGESREGDQPFEIIRLQPLMPAFKGMFRKALIEAYAAGIVKDMAAAGEYYKRMLGIIGGLDGILDRRCLENGVTREEPTEGIYNFYKETQSHPYFEHFALAFPSYFNRKILHNLDREMAKLKNIGDATNSCLRQPGEGSRSLQAFLGRFRYFPPHWKVEVTPTALSRQILQVMLENERDVEDLSPGYLAELIRESSEEQRFCGGTVARKLEDFDTFIEATRSHRTLWGSIERFRDKLLESYDDLVDEDEEGHEEEKSILAEMDEDLETPCGSAEQENANNNESELHEYKEKHKAKRMQYKYHAHHKAGGLLRLVPCWDSPRVIPYNKICTFLGYISKKASTKDGGRYQHLGRIFMESLLSGASVKNIVLGKTHTERVLGMPAGLFLSLEEMIEDTLLPKETILQDCRKVVHEFGVTYPENKFTLMQVHVTARAWHIDKSRLLSPVEQSHISGSLPGMRSSLFYVLPDRILESFHESSRMFLERLLCFSGEHRQLGNGYAETVSEYIDASRAVIETAIRGLESDMKKRSAIWEKNKPDIVFTEKTKIQKIITALCSKLDSENTEARDSFVLLEASVLYFVYLILLLRKGEGLGLTDNSFCYDREFVLVAGKQNRAFKASRYLYESRQLREMLKTYEKIREEAEELFMKQRKSRGTSKSFFLFENKALNMLNEIIREASGDLRGEVYSLRKFSATLLHNTRIKDNPHEFCKFLAIMGHHSLQGYYVLSSNSYTKPSEIRVIQEAYADVWSAEIETVTKRILERWKTISKA